jgi:hypothetical protein
MTFTASLRQSFAAAVFVLLCAKAVFAANDPLASVPASNSLKFKVFMSGQDIGSLTIAFRRDGETLHTETNINFNVRFAFITVYRYDHHNEEVWRDGLLQSLDATTDDDGDRKEVHVRPDGDLLRIRTTSETYQAPRTALPSNYWNKGLMAAPVGINNQLGEPISLEARLLRSETVTAGGQQVQAQHYRLLGYDFAEGGGRKPKPYLDIDLWYDSANVLVHMAFQYKGFEFVYVLE